MTLLDLTARPTSDARLATLPVAIIGAGPVGLAAAAHLLERGIDVVVLEAGETSGSSIRRWGHTRLFSSWRHLIDPAARRLLEDAGWTEPADLDQMPTGQELIDEYLEPLAALDPLASRIRLSTRVAAVGKDGIDRTRTEGRANTPFLLQIQDAEGMTAELRARAVIDASGTYETPNPLASTGLELPGGAGIADRVSHALPDVAGADLTSSPGDTPPSSERGTRRRTRCWLSPTLPTRCPAPASPGCSAHLRPPGSRRRRLTSCRAVRTWGRGPMSSSSPAA
ncbi:MAG: FAD-dependent oxidoreductase [Dietzia sp.]|nr:FAD-dependent oxidoreductase [Dietzia sp.]